MTRGRAPQIKATVYAAGWLLQRITPRDTLIMVPESVNGSAPNIQDAISNIGSPVGGIEIVKPVNTVRNVIDFLAGFGGVHVDWRLTDWAIPVTPIRNDQAIFWSIAELLGVAKPEYSYDSQGNTLVIYSRLDKTYSMGPVFEIPIERIVSANASPVITRRVKRLAVGFRR